MQWFITQIPDRRPLASLAVYGAPMNATPQLLLTLSPAPATSAEPVSVYMSTLSPGSRKSVAHALDTVARHLSSGHHRRQTLTWEDLDYAKVVALRAWLVERYAPATAQRMLATVKGVLREAFRLGLLSLEDHVRLGQVASIPVRREPCGRRLTWDEAERLSAVAEPGAGGDRDRALIYLMLATGVRRGEVVSLDLCDVRRDDRNLHVRGAKRGARRVVPISSRAWPPLERWLATRGGWPGPLFTPVDQRRGVVRERLAPNSINFILRRLGGRAGVVRFAPHDTRRTAVSGVLEAGLDVFEAATFAGHRSVSTTAIYDLRGDEARRRAVERYMGDPSTADNLLPLHAIGDQPDMEDSRIA